MQVIGNYDENGYAHVQGLIPQEIAQAFIQSVKEDLANAPIPLSGVRQHPNLLKRAAFEVYGHHYKPMLFFLWGITPLISSIVGRDLLPTYDYLRLYREGDVCRVHHDRLSCEHSLSLVLDYSDGEIWDLQVGSVATEPSARVEEDFGSEPFASIAMRVGDAVLYRGVNHRHGRMAPNPNAWSAHLFLHWVDKDGPHRDHAFDGKLVPRPVNFSFT
ncbi:hypothetical protein [Sphingomonas sp. AX6]|uniref:hypothetical protein n=1 Tax=Sphingomonas sp. AX6 TaxID=2653171 RepID=UPI0012EF479D|nr:hypothetical protein [Sphingomonas sp. AX6]VXC86928.1 conserved hypothetical protein [Sphingomonas sp. AX6]